MRSSPCSRFFFSSYILEYFFCFGFDLLFGLSDVFSGVYCCVVCDLCDHRRFFLPGLCRGFISFHFI